MKSQISSQIEKQITPEQILFWDLQVDLILRINQILKEKKIGKKQLAVILGKQPSEISKWLNGEHNFTLKTIAKLSAAFNEPLIEISRQKISTSITQSAYFSR
jgi:transcriptional regulator with XRE-family HTH domain